VKSSVAPSAVTSAAYCFGCFFDRREPLPAAGMSAKTDKETI